MENTGLVIEQHDPSISAVLHDAYTPKRQGSIPASARNLLTEATDPLSVSFRGWGRWNTAITSLSSITTRDPALSSMSAPQATRSDSMSRQLIDAWVCLRNTASSVLRCFLRTLQ